MAGNVDDPAFRPATFAQMVDMYYEQVAALVEGGVDILLPETAFDTLVLKACLFAIDKYFVDHDVRLPVMASITISKADARCRPKPSKRPGRRSRMLTCVSVGINCALGPEQHATLPAGVVADCAGVRQLLSQCGLAECLWRL